MTLSFAFVCYRGIERFSEFEHSWKVLKTIPLMSEIGKESQELENKVKYLHEKNVLFSNLLKMKPPTLYLVDNDTDQVTAVNQIFFKGVLWEKKTFLNLNKEALGAVLAHELYHIKHYHYVRGLLVRFFVLALGLIGSSFFVAETAAVKAPYWLPYFLLSFAGCVQAVNWIVLITDNFINRFEELACDRFSIEAAGAEAFKQEAFYFQEAEKKAEASSQSKIYPLPVAAIRSFVLNTHPSWEKRLMLIPKDNP